MSTGDLIVFEAADNPISQMIRYYDRSEFTHVGLDVGDGTVVSCRTEGGLFVAGEDGGVRVDELAELRAEGRRWRRAPVVDVDPVAKDAAVDRALRWREEDGLGETSGFSFPKMFQCATAVSASRPGVFSDQARADMVDAAFAAARAWRYDPDDDERPASFFCAEMVLEAYDGVLEVPREYLAPPPEPMSTDAPTRTGLPDLVADLIDSWRDGGRSRTMTTLVIAVGKHDPEFFGGAVLNLARWVRDENKERADVVRGAEPDHLPPGLVTPRMLLDCTDVVGPVSDLWPGD